MLFDAILQSPEFFSGVWAFFISYILLPTIGVMTGLAFTILVYGYIKMNHLGDYYTQGEDEGKKLMSQGFIYLILCIIIFIITYLFLA